MFVKKNTLLSILSYLSFVKKYVIICFVYCYVLTNKRRLRVFKLNVFNIYAKLFIQLYIRCIQFIQVVMFKYFMIVR